MSNETLKLGSPKQLLPQHPRQKRQANSIVNIQDGTQYEVQEKNPPNRIITFQQLQEQFWR